VAPTDAVTSLLIDGGVPPHEISLALAYEEVCGGGCFQEIYRLRPLWALYLAATNLESHPLTLSSLLGDQELPKGIGYRPFSRRIDSTNDEQKLPPAPIPPGGTMLVPLALLLAPIENALGEILSAQSAYIPTGQRQDFAHEDLTTAYAGTALIGPAVWPRAIRIAGSVVTSEQPIHEFDLSNLYTIGRSWEAGSCPHIFAVGEQIRYLGEIFSLTPSLRQRERFIVPDGIGKLVVAELEAETTIVEQVLINEEKVRSRVNLECGEFIELGVQPGDIVELTGYYIPERFALPDPWFRNIVVYEFMQGHKRW
jgi:hypothetical protein